MAPKQKIIIDTDPGNDDIIAILLALAAPASELEVLLVSVVEGNIDVRACARNVVALLHVLDEEIKWREANRLPPGFEGCTKYKPLVAIGASESLHDKSDNADYFHGTDGLGGSTVTHPEFNPDESWSSLFDHPPPEDKLTKTATQQVSNLEKKPFNNFSASRNPAHREILRLLKENEPDTITIVAIGPLTNIALAAAEDPETFLRAKQLVCMGGAVEALGNVTPNAEFNVWADPHAAARVFALSSARPSSTMPPTVEKYAGEILPAYPAQLTRTLKIVLMALDITEEHTISRSVFMRKSTELSQRGSPLARWMQAFLIPMLDKMAFLHHGHDEDATLALHDPLCIYYMLTESDPRWKASAKSPEDIRVECIGQWTRGMTVADKRLRKRRNSDGEVPHDRGNWLGNKSGNRIHRMLESPDKEGCGSWMLDRILGYVQ